MRKWYELDSVDHIDTPALLVYPDRVKHNIDTAIKMIGDRSRLRPHIKTSKSADVAKLMLAAGISKFKSATIAEAEMLGQCEAPDILLAYQPVGPKTERLFSLIRQYPGSAFSCIIDNEESARDLSFRASASGLWVSVYIDLNVGQNRTGIKPGKQALDLYVLCSQLPGLKPVGLHAYDGHIRDMDFEQREKKTDAAFAPVLDLIKNIKSAGIPDPILIAGGSPGFSIHCKKTDRESSPGTFVYWDKGYSEICPEQEFMPAALVLTRIISMPAENLVCLDLGHKSLAAENDISRRVSFLDSPDWKPVGQSEEHLVMELKSGHGIKCGDHFYGMPYHICPTVALYDFALTVNSGKLSGQWKTTARNRVLTI
jgi:D-threonine aldolase